MTVMTTTAGGQIAYQVAGPADGPCWSWSTGWATPAPPSAS
ncbi:hypothetical protein [Nonomuraea sp. LPB2021202275-12-8]